MLWAYTSIVRPMVTYGSLVWAHRAPKYASQFQSLQRLAILTTGHYRLSTPGAGLEMITNLTPIDIYVEGEAAMAARRILGRNPTRWDGIGKKGKRGHLWRASNTLPNLDFVVPLDVAPVRFHWDNRFCIDYDSFNVGEPATLDAGTMVCYTDGSHLGGRTGWGYCATNVTTSQDIHACGYLGESASVFQAEIYAIERVADVVRNNHHVKELSYVSTAKRLCWPLTNLTRTQSQYKTVLMP